MCMQNDFSLADYLTLNDVMLVVIRSIVAKELSPIIIIELMKLLYGKYCTLLFSFIWQTLLLLQWQELVWDFIFMGDTGSLALGGALAAMALCTGMFFSIIYGFWCLCHGSIISHYAGMMMLLLLTLNTPQFKHAHVHYTWIL